MLLKEQQAQRSYAPVSLLVLLPECKRIEQIPHGMPPSDTKNFTNPPP